MRPHRPDVIAGLTPALNTATSRAFSALNSAMGSTVSRKSYLFTSESVSEGHPDKVCDRISDTIVDAFLAADPESRVAVETLCTTNRVVLAGEVRGPKSVTPEV